jgi:hypothetical protein
MQSNAVRKILIANDRLDFILLYGFLDYIYGKIVAKCGKSFFSPDLSIDIMTFFQSREAGLIFKFIIVG